ncbi:MAG TPA: hypothetical protein VD837_02255 [Terriglobales bacterium]|nr:hypothetical protein [Terriglobales bacterium]
MTTSRRICFLLATIAFLAGATLAYAAEVERGVTVAPLTIHISPDATSAKLANMDRGRELVVLERSRDWIHVTADVTRERTVTGWMKDQAVVRANTPNGDRILFGEAADSEAEASRRHGRRGAAQDAMRLYAFTEEYFPKSPLAGEALYRAADIRWQLEKADVMSRPSAKERDAYLRTGMEEDWMRRVMKKYAGTKWADLAAFALIDNKLCGDWKGESKCPEKETEMYEKYAAERPQSPSAAEALYQAAWRQSALIQIYRTENKANKADEAKARALALAQKTVSQYPNNVDWSARAQRLVFLVDQGIPTYGTAAATSSSDDDGPSQRP